MRHITSTGYQLIIAFEGFSPIPYRCPAGYLTVGYGHVVRAGEIFRQPISAEEGRRLLEADVGHVEAAVVRLIPVPLTDGQFDALVSFTYNLGAGALQRSSLRQKLLRGEVRAAGEEFPRWIYAGGRRLPGLVRRREMEQKVYSS